MILTSQHRCDVRDFIKESLNDRRFLSAFSQSVADVAIKKLSDKFNALLLIVGDHEEKMTKLKTENENLRKQMNRVEQNRRMKRLRFIGVPKKEREDLLDPVTHFLTTKLDLAPSDINIEKFYRVPNKDKNKVRPVVVVFSTLGLRDRVFKRKSKLKRSTVIINEDLTPFYYKLFNSCESVFGQKNVWTLNRRIYAPDKEGERKLIEGLFQWCRR
ncbi:hypothetical protein WA026_020846 [Henosepilachna vigintioctopunctata]|uniref:Uncharacterized protein n=1 Tax=Henosepilachna vigintioctopunctata TaxID=420089 RepID=A0AAW1TRZ9_9CUCU